MHDASVKLYAIIHESKTITATPANIVRNKFVIITSRRRFGVIMTYLLRRLFAGVVSILILMNVSNQDKVNTKNTLAIIGVPVLGVYARVRAVRLQASCLRGYGDWVRLGIWLPIRWSYGLLHKILEASAAYIIAHILTGTDQHNVSTENIFQHRDIWRF